MVNLAALVTGKNLNCPNTQQLVSLLTKCVLSLFSHHSACLTKQNSSDKINVTNLCWISFAGHKGQIFLFFLFYYVDTRMTEDGQF